MLYKPVGDDLAQAFQFGNRADPDFAKPLAALVAEVAEDSMVAVTSEKCRMS